MKERIKLRDEQDGNVWRMRSRATIYREHRHDELEVNLVTRGVASYLVDGHRFDLKRDTLIWLFPEQNHVLIDQSPDYAMELAIIRPEVLRRICTDGFYHPMLGMHPPGPFCKQLAPDRAAELRQLFQQVTAVFAEKDMPRANAGVAYVMLTAWRVHETAEDPCPGADIHPAVERAVQVIRDGGDDADVESLGRRCGLSGSRLSRLFKEQTGVPLARFRQRQRLERFFSLYRHGHRHNMTEAALASGFGSYAQFHRVFVSHMGQGPAAYFRARDADESSHG